MFGTKVAYIAIDHVARFDRRARAVSTDHRSEIECICHMLFKRRVGNYFHGNRLITTKDIHAIHINIEEVKITLQISIGTNQDWSKDHMTSLIRQFHYVASGLDLTSTVICQIKILLTFAVGRAIRVCSIGNWEN